MKDVSMFIPCTVDLFLPHIGEATASLLRRGGVNPVYHRGQTCCGQPAMNSGYRKEAKKAAKHFIELFGNDHRESSLDALPDFGSFRKNRDRSVGSNLQESIWRE